eukprot:5688215-Prymnesium_polylepis.1
MFRSTKNHIRSIRNTSLRTRTRSAARSAAQSKPGRARARLRGFARLLQDCPPPPKPIIWRLFLLALATTAAMRVGGATSALPSRARLVLRHSLGLRWTAISL